jgi:hypothetical protein
MRFLKGSLLVVALLGLSSRADAVFRAADFVIVPMAAATAGLNSSVWRTDLEITNVDTDPIDVVVVLLPTGNNSNKAWYADIKNALGWSADLGFTHIEPKLGAIPAGRTVNLPDVVKAPWGDGNTGALLLWAYKAGTYTSTVSSTVPQGGQPRKIVVRSRTYSLGKTAQDLQVTYGQGVPGIPWYYYLDPTLKTRGLDHAIFSGIRQDGNFRSAFGLVNVSDSLTSLYVNVKLLKEDGTVVAESQEALEPLAHIQYNNFLQEFFFKAATDTIANGTLEITVTSFLSTAASPQPALIAYVSYVDNITNDTTYLEQAFTPELPWNCVFNGLSCPTPLPTVTVTPSYAPARAGGPAQQSGARSHLMPPTAQAAP